MSTETKQGSGSLWAMVWMTFLTIGVIAGAGVYLDYRLETFEKQVLSQNEASQEAILKNREVSADFANQFTSTIKEMSQLLTTTVESVSQHTTALALAIEKNEQSQSEALKASLEELSKEIRAENQRLRTTLARLSDDLGSAGEWMKALAAANESQAVRLDGVERTMVSLTRQAETLNQSIAKTIADKASVLEDRLVAIEEASSQNIDEIHGQISALQKGQRRIMETGSQTFSALNSNIKDVRSAQMEWQQDVASRKNKSAATMVGIHDNLKTLADQMEVGFAANNDQTDILRSDLAEMSQTLSDRTEDLLVQLIRANTTNTEERGEQSREIGAALQSFSEQTHTSMKALDSLQTLMSKTLARIDTQSEEGKRIYTAIVELQTTLDDFGAMANAVPASLEEKPLGLSKSNEAADWFSTLPQSGATETVVFKGSDQE